MFTLPLAPNSALRPENQKMPEMWLPHQNRFQKNSGLVQKPRHKRSGRCFAEVQVAAETGKTLQKNVKQKRRRRRNSHDPAKYPVVNTALRNAKKD